MPNVLQQIDAEMAAMVEGIAPALVRVHSGRGGIGAATIWHPDGLIVTNAHVVQRYPVAVTLADGRTLPARLLACDTARDLAALVVDATALPTVKLGDSRNLQPGQWVMALGHPWGVLGSVTAGVVIGVGPDWPELPRSGSEWIVASLPLRPGYSGGPLVDAYGRLVGINAMMRGPHVAMAVPVHVATAFLREALASREVAA
ncbi:MAG TPA: trypsin-like peptidase domain-containing protein [Dehalococcoidia bacterium]|nr:trypsin-like peptidase domain-containing protein [Dehalococcoidia bacterium]